MELVIAGLGGTRATPARRAAATYIRLLAGYVALLEDALADEAGHTDLDGMLSDLERRLLPAAI
jgi:hypothetical protein